MSRAKRNPHRNALPQSRLMALHGAADVRGYEGVESGPPWLLIGGVALVALALAFSKRKVIMSTASSVASGAAGLFGKAFDFAKGQAFKLALPSNVGRYAAEMLSAGQRYGVDPWVLAGIMYGESLGGDALRPSGPGGCGDWTPRTSGQVGYQYADPATGLPPGLTGWGLGLMQIDFGVHHDWYMSGANWRDPQTNINKAASIFAEHLKYFSSPAGGAVQIECWRLTTGLTKYKIEPWRTKYPGVNLPTCSPGAKTVGPYPDPRPLTGAKLYEAALASYNAGTKGVLQAVALGLPAEAPTATQSYVSKFLARVGSWSAKLG